MYVKSLNILIRTKYSASIPSAEFCEKHVFLSLSKSSLSLHYSWLTAIRDDASVAGLLWSQHQFILSASYIWHWQSQNQKLHNNYHWLLKSTCPHCPDCACVHPQLPGSINFTLKLVKMSRLGLSSVSPMFHMGWWEVGFKCFKVKWCKYTEIHCSHHTGYNYIPLKMDQN